jgi:hypothetical protein
MRWKLVVDDKMSVARLLKHGVSNYIRRYIYICMINMWNEVPFRALVF